MRIRVPKMKMYFVRSQKSYKLKNKRRILKNEQNRISFKDRREGSFKEG